MNQLSERWLKSLNEPTNVLVGCGRMMSRGATSPSAEPLYREGESCPSVSAVVLNWNGAHLLPDCLESLKRQDYPRLEIVVADNGSTDASAQVAEDHGVRFVALGRNLGFAGGNNAGARMVDADY